jgi:ABC-2 type transport system permease protein
MTTTAQLADEVVPGRAGVPAVLVWELEKLAAQWRTRVAFAVCVVGPFAFAAAMRLSQTVPADTLFGRWIHDSGFAVPLVILGFAGSWALPLLVSLVAGDIFSAEDHLGTWPLLLTRSVRAMTVHLAKLAAVVLYSVAMIVVLAVSGTAAGLLIEGARPLVTLSGLTVSGGAALADISLSWASILLPALAYAAVATAISVRTRNSLAGIIPPTVLGLLLQLLVMLPVVSPIRDALPSTTFIAWHGLFTQPHAVTALVRGQLWNAGYAVLFFGIALFDLHRRDEANR